MSFRAGRNSSFGPKQSIAPNSRVATRVVFNVGGIRFETFKSTLKAIPDTRLAWLTNSSGNNPDYDDTTGEYFFDRHPGVFTMILNYYRTGKLHAPTDVCGPLFEEELAFWGIDEKQIEPCCWGTYRAHRDAQETLADFDNEDDNDDDDSNDEIDDDEIAKRFGIVNETARTQKSWYDRWRPRIWLWLEDPNSSHAATVLAASTALFVLLSICTFCVETHPKFRSVKPNSSIPSGATVREMKRLTEPYLYLRVFEGTCMAYFTVDIIVRFIFCPSKKKHLLNILTLLDLLSVVPFYIRELIKGIDPDLESSDTVYFLNSLRLVMILRILKLTKHFSGFKILGHTLKASAKELLLMILVLALGVLTFACLIYYAEQIEEAKVNDFDNIPIGFWWAVVTMTTLGYGDLYPRTALGYIVGAVCALCGLLMLALPVPVIVNNFTLYYSHAQARLKLPKKTRNTLICAADALKASSSPSSSCALSINGSVTSLPSLGQTTKPMPSNEHDTTNEPASKLYEVGSLDSGYKAETPQQKTPRDGINVIYTDETSYNYNYNYNNNSNDRSSFPCTNHATNTNHHNNNHSHDATTRVYCDDDPNIITIVINDKPKNKTNNNKTHDRTKKDSVRSHESSNSNWSYGFENNNSHDDVNDTNNRQNSNDIQNGRHRRHSNEQGNKNNNNNKRMSPKNNPHSNIVNRSKTHSTGHHSDDGSTRVKNKGKKTRRMSLFHKKIADVDV